MITLLLILFENAERTKAQCFPEAVNFAVNRLRNCNFNDSRENE